jgi:hypothetical protein
MNTPTPRTDAATYPADCLGKTLVTNRDCARALERELTTLTAERERVRVLREALEKYAHTVIAGGSNPARAALAATEGAK